MLWRVYGTAWLTQPELDQYLWRLEEADRMHAVVTLFTAKR